MKKIKLLQEAKGDWELIIIMLKQLDASTFIITPLTLYLVGEFILKITEGNMESVIQSFIVYNVLISGACSFSYWTKNSDAFHLFRAMLWITLPVLLLAVVIHTVGL